MVPSMFQVMLNGGVQRLYRKIGSGDWLQVTEANGDNTSTTLSGSPTSHSGTSCWFCNSQGSGVASHEDYGIGNCAASFLDSPNTTETIYYTIYWKSALGSSTYNAPLYLNRGHIHNHEIRPSPMSSITASEIWSGGSPYIPPTHGVISVYNNKIGIDNTTPTYDLDVSGNINFTGTLYQDGVAFSGGGSGGGSSYDDSAILTRLTNIENNYITSNHSSILHFLQICFQI